MKFVKARGSLKVYLLNQLQFFEQGHQPENRGIIGAGFVVGAALTNFLQGERVVSLKKDFENPRASWRDPKALGTQQIQDRFQREGRSAWGCGMVMRGPGHEENSASQA